MKDIYSLAQEISSSATDNLWLHLLITCLAIVTVYFGVRIKKSAELKEINDNFSKVLKQQKEITKETGEIKQQLNKGSISYQIKLSAYHEKSITSIESVYLELIKIKRAALELGFNNCEGTKRAFDIACVSFRDVLDSKRIWLPKALADNLENIAVEIDHKSRKFLFADSGLNRPDSLKPGLEKKMIEDLDEYYEYMNGEVESIIRDLIDTISKEINVEEKD